MQAVVWRAEAILRGLPAEIPNDPITLRALMLAAVSALYETGISRSDVLCMAGGDWDAVHEALQEDPPCYPVVANFSRADVLH